MWPTAVAIAAISVLVMMASSGGVNEAEYYRADLHFSPVVRQGREASTAASTSVVSPS